MDYILRFSTNMTPITRLGQRKDVPWGKLAGRAWQGYRRQIRAADAIGHMARTIGRAMVLSERIVHPIAASKRSG